MSLQHSRLKKYIPKYCYVTIFDIDYKTLYADGKKIILFDLDNTIVSYDILDADLKVMTLFKDLQEIGFEIVIISNNNSKRVKRFLTETGLSYIARAFKPLKRGYKKALKLVQTQDKDAIIAIGDQLLTDVLGANRFGIDVILVKALIKNTEKWYTSINRRNERRIINKIKLHDLEKYTEIIRIYEE